MAEPVPYPGSPSLSAEAREKVLHTFRHTLEMARAGRNEDALLGCDFILKMDARFAPARKLLASLRGVAAGTVVDLSEFDAFGGPAPAAPRPAAPAPPAPAPAGPEASWAAPAPAPAGDPFGMPGGGLDDLRFDDLGANPFAAPPPAPAPPPAAPATPASGLQAEAGFGGAAPDPFAPAAPGFGEAPPQDDPFAAPMPSAFGAPPPPPLDPFAPAGPAADLFAAPADPFAAAPPAPAPAPAAPAAGVDPRIAQFLRQGDEAAARGQVQEAIDLWSRVFLIDLSNEEASRRIDAAREKQNEAARQLDMLLSDGVQLYESGDLQAARGVFLKVLTLSESDATARNYLNQIDGALAGAPAAGGPGPAAPADVEPYLRDELESPVRPSFAEDLLPLEEHGGEESAFEEPPAGMRRPAPAEAAPARGGRIDVRVLLGIGAVVLVGVGLLAFLLFRPKPVEAPPASAAPAARPAAANPLEKAQALFRQGKVDEALGILTAIPADDPRHDQALVLIDQFKSSAEPTPVAAPAVSEAQVDEARLAGLAALSSGRYIDAVKSLDLVVKARPEDAEAQQALSKARESVAALGSAIRSYNEQDYESATRLLWALRKQDPKNRDVEDYLFKSYFNEGVLNLQSGGTKKAAESFKEAVGIRPQDAEAQRHLKFARQYAGGTNDLLSRIYVRHVTPRP